MAKELVKKLESTTEWVALQRVDSAYWLITKNEPGLLEVLTINHNGEKGEEALAVFSFEEEAEMFLWLGEVDDSWHASESAAGELTSILYTLCAGVKKVVLDPLPQTLEEKTIGRLVSLDRDRFVERLLSWRPCP